MFQKICGVLLLIAAGLVATRPSSFDYFAIARSELASLSTTPWYEEYRLRTDKSDESPFARTISTDLLKLMKENQIPKAWSKIKTVRYNFNSESSKKLLMNTGLSIVKKNKKGSFHLEIEFIEVPDDKEPTVILQFSLFNLKSKNKIWELGRTYQTSKKNPD